MKTELKDRKDIEILVNNFYGKVFQDELLEPYFHHIIKSDWEKHLNTMYKFWENVLFYTGDYYGNPLYVHNKIHSSTPLTSKAFERWLQLFLQTVEELFEGTNAELAKQRAVSIATVMQMKIFGNIQGHPTT